MLSSQMKCNSTADMGYQNFPDSIIELATDINDYLKDSAEKLEKYCG